MMVVVAKSRRAQPRSKNYELRKHYELPSHILESIFRRLCSIDIFRAKAVCPSWNSAAKSLLTSKSHMCLSKTPWLVVPPEQNRGASVCIKNLEENMVYSLKLEFDLNCCIGSSHGWLIVAGSKAPPFLLNPFTLAVIQLPPIIDFPLDARIKKFAAYNVNSKSQLPEGFWVKAIMTAEPCANNYSVVLIFERENQRRIAYSNDRDGSWAELDGKHASYEDIICHGNQLSALSSEGSIETWDFQEGCPEKSMDIHLPFPKKSLDKEKSFEKDFIRMLYLVELGGEILLVVRYAFCRNRYGYWHPPPAYATQIFHVYKLNFSEKKWMEVKSLKDYSMFLGRNHSVSISTRDSWSCEANSIYFTDDHGFIGTRNRNGCLDVGVYNMEDERIGQIYGNGSVIIDLPPCFLVPGPS